MFKMASFSDGCCLYHINYMFNFFGTFTVYICYLLPDSIISDVVGRINYTYNLHVLSHLGNRGGTDSKK